MRISSSVSIHNVQKIGASTCGTSGAPLTISCRAGNWENGAAEIVIFTGDQILTDRLITTINTTMAERQIERDAIEAAKAAA
jgi:hypothetical protein